LNEAFNSGITRITNDSANSATGNRRNKPDDGEHLNVERTNRMPTIAIRNPAEPKISIEGQLNSAGFVKDITDGRNRWREQQGTTPFTIKTTSKLREGRDVSNGGSEFWRKAIHEENHYGPSNYPIECNTVVPKLQPQQKEKIDSAFTKTVSGKSDNSNCAVVRPTISTASTSKKAPIVFENLQRNKKHELEKSLQRVRQLRENGTREYSKANNKFKTEPHHPN
jgi:hypothetical protein